MQAQVVRGIVSIAVVIALGVGAGCGGGGGGGNDNGGPGEPTRTPTPARTFSPAPPQTIVGATPTAHTSATSTTVVATPTAVDDATPSNPVSTATPAGAQGSATVTFTMSANAGTVLGFQFPVPPTAHGSFKQIAYVVDDLAAAIASWVEIVHAGPFFRIDNAQATDMRYRGDGAEATLSLAVGNSGGVQIELIQLMDGAPSVYRELPRGVHHLALLARDFEAESARLERLGHPVAWALTLPGICRVRY